MVVVISPSPALDGVLAGLRGLSLLRQVAAIHGMCPGAAVMLALLHSACAGSPMSQPKPAHRLRHHGDALPRSASLQNAPEFLPPPRRLPFGVFSSMLLALLQVSSLDTEMG